MNTTTFKRLLILTFMSGAFLTVSQPSIATSWAVPNRDPNSDQFLLGYDPQGFVLDVNKSPYELANFVVQVTNGVGHLQSRPSPTTNRNEVYKEPGLLTWDDRITFYNGSKWVKLSLKTATELFGVPRKRGKDNLVFYTFDAFSVYEEYKGEHQLFHIDMKFNEAGDLASYRIRGIGFNNPTWVSN
ncbi:MAG: hypothetical protein WCT03_06400 [Candidatus Obscuribacterales bacterium]